MLPRETFNVFLNTHRAVQRNADMRRSQKDGLLHSFTLVTLDVLGGRIGGSPACYVLAAEPPFVIKTTGTRSQTLAASAAASAETPLPGHRPPGGRAGGSRSSF